MSEAEQPQQQEPDGHHDQRFYTREFKLEAVRLSESSEKAVARGASFWFALPLARPPAAT